MGTAYDSVLTLLEGQKVIYEDLLSISKEKQTELVKGSLEALDSLTKREEALIFQAGRLEDERFHYTNELITSNGLETNATITEVFQAAPAEVKERMEGIHREMVEALGELDKINRENMSLIQQSLRILNYTIEAITQDKKITYSADEGMIGEKKSLLLDRRV